MRAATRSGGACSTQWIREWCRLQRNRMSRGCRVSACAGDGSSCFLIKNFNRKFQAGHRSEGRAPLSVNNTVMVIYRTRWRQGGASGMIACAGLARRGTGYSMNREARYATARTSTTTTKMIPSKRRRRASKRPGIVESYDTGQRLRRVFRETQWCDDFIGLSRLGRYPLRRL